MIQLDVSFFRIRHKQVDAVGSISDVDKESIDVWRNFPAVPDKGESVFLSDGGDYTVVARVWNGSTGCGGGTVPADRVVDVHVLVRKIERG